jgi:hypothetical protein
MAKRKEIEWTFGGMLKVERFARYDAFPNCAIRILEEIEEREKSEDDPIVIETLDLFHNILTGLCWEVYTVQAVLYPKEEDEGSWAQSQLVGRYEVIVAECVRKLCASLDCDNVQKVLIEALGLANAGITFGNFTEYTAWSTAARFLLRLHKGIVEKITKIIFGKKSCLADIDINDKRLGKWFSDLRREYLSVMPPADDWPLWKVRADEESLCYKIGAELYNTIDFFEKEGVPITYKGKEAICSRIMEKSISCDIVQVLIQKGKLKRIQIEKFTQRSGGHLNAVLNSLKTSGIIIHKSPYFEISPEYLPVLMSFRNISGR